MISWEELLKNRKPMTSLRNSGHMMECIDLVKKKYPNAVIEEVSQDSWRLMCDGQPLSNPQSSHYACWIEAREVMDDAG